MIGLIISSNTVSGGGLAILLFKNWGNGGIKGFKTTNIKLYQGPTENSGRDYVYYVKTESNNQGDYGSCFVYSLFNRDVVPSDGLTYVDTIPSDVTEITNIS